MRHVAIREKCGRCEMVLMECVRVCVADSALRLSQPMECKESDAAKEAAAADPIAATAAASAATSSAAAAASSLSTTGAVAAAASSSPGPVVSLGEVTLLVDHFLSTHYPKVSPLFRLEAKDTLASVRAAANPRSLHTILNEYVQLKAKADRDRALTKALCNQADPSGAAAAASPESCALTRTMAALTSLLSDYSTHKHTPGLPSNKRGFTQTAIEPAAPAAMQDDAVPAAAAVVSKASQAASASNAASSAPEPSPAKRRRKGRPIRNILPTPVAANEQTHANPAFAMAPLMPAAAAPSAATDATDADATATAAAASPTSEAGPLSPPFHPPQSVFHLPDHLPVQKLGSDGYVAMGVDPQGYESLFMSHASSMQQQQWQGAAANGRAASNDEFGGANGNGPSFADTLATFINEQQSTWNQPNPQQASAAAASPRPFQGGLSPSVVDAIAEQALTHPSTMEAVDSSFVFEVVPASTTPIKQPSATSLRGASQSRVLAATSASPPPRASRSNSAARSPSKPKPTGVAAPLPSSSPPATAAAAATSSSAPADSAPSAASLLSLLHTYPVDEIIATRRATSNSKKS